MKMVWVRWRDAAIDTSQFYDDDLDSNDPLVTVESVGWLVGETKDALMLSLHRVEDQGKWRVLMGIPKVNVIKKRYLK